MRRFLRAALGSHGLEIVEAATLGEATRRVTSRRFDLVLLDLGLPDGDGLALAAELRGFTGVPIIVLSARRREDDKVQALDAGADDYLTKPFGMNELLARMRVALRHAERAAREPEPAVEHFGPLSLDRARRRVEVSGREIRLTPTEYRMLNLLADHAGRVLTHRQIAQGVWGDSRTVEAHHVRVHMALLRKKLEASPARPRLLLTEPGVGYRLCEPDLET
ncbi:MAG: response regulator [Polyangiaceae bacterium]|nr:response regulator [Polyangiaceae bacterium]